MDFGSVMVAMVTLFDKENNIDQKANRKLIQKLCEDGVDTIVLAGSTGEGQTLSDNEKLELAQLAKSTKNNNVKLILNVGTNDTYKSIQFAERVEKLNVVDGIMAVCPYYNKPNQEGIFQHFKAINNATGLPLMVYHIPSRTNVTLDLDTMKRLIELNNVTMMKDSEGDLEKINDLTHHIRTNRLDVSIYSGDDPTIIPYLSVGAKGVVSVAANLNTTLIKEMINDYHKGHVEEASEKKFLLNKEVKKMFPGFAPNPVAVKYLVSEAGFGSDRMRLPLVPLTKTEKKTIKHII